ncbi:hypothetical protein [Hymenobacter sp. AT01-02]|uniref:hypothetical protein n=1 Tax=Hymenobacter sp. AT01-02 TaxID=1571877 RepID=UPI0005F26A8A|nr:hypothetical protein [Hymenobacter sp. AT01-02]
MALSSSPYFFENPAGRIRIDPAGFVRADWNKEGWDIASLQALFQHMHLAMQRTGWGKMLVNQSVMRAFSPAEQQWISQTWLPSAVQQAGYRYGAVVVSSNVFTRLATAYITTSVQGLPLVYSSFSDEGSAVTWLLGQ